MLDERMRTSVTLASRGRPWRSVIRVLTLPPSARRSGSRGSPGRAAAARRAPRARPRSIADVGVRRQRLDDDARRPRGSRPRRSRASSPPACRRERPDAMVGGRSSNGTVLRFTVSPTACEPLLGVLARPLRGAQVELEEVRVRPAGEDVDAARDSVSASASAFVAHLLLVRAERRRSRRCGSRSPSPRSRARAARPGAPGTPRGRSPCACSSRQSTNPARGPASVLWVVEVTTSQSSTGFGCSPAATRPAKCAMSHQSSAPTSSATRRNIGVSTVRGYAEPPQMMSFGRCSRASASTSSSSTTLVSRETP